MQEPGARTQSQTDETPLNSPPSRCAASIGPPVQTLPPQAAAREGIVAVARDSEPLMLESDSAVLHVEIEASSTLGETDVDKLLQHLEETKKSTSGVLDMVLIMLERQARQAKEDGQAYEEVVAKIKQTDGRLVMMDNQLSTYYQDAKKKDKSMAKLEERLKFFRTDLEEARRQQSVFEQNAAAAAEERDVANEKLAKVTAKLDRVGMAMLDALEFKKV